MTSPCATCATLADCGTCADFGAWLAVTHPDPPPCPVCVDADWLLLSGEQFDQVCARLGILRASLIVHLRRHGQDHLIPRRQPA